MFLTGFMMLEFQKSVTSEPRLSSTHPNAFYVNRRPPLMPSPLQTLPPGAVRAKGWLKVQIDLQCEGFSGRLEQISRFLNPADNAWLGTGSSQRAGWEEVPYWLRGQVALGYVSGSKRILDSTKKWIEGALKSAKPDGWFGPESNRETKFGTPDLWPNMLMQAALQTYYDATSDQRVLNLMLGYCRFLSNLPDDKLLDKRHYWHYQRVGDQLASIIWLYDRTGETFLLELARRLHGAGADWKEGIANYHGVNFAQGFREPATFAVFSNDPSDLAATEKDLNLFRGEFGQSPGGMYAADENARKGKTDPRQATESCSVAEMMFSHELLMQFTGDPAWGDRAEDVAFNWMPVTMTSDLKALRYLQSPNMAISDGGSKSPGVENGGPMFLMDPNDHRCCQHNIGMAWPYFTQHLWFATNGNGLLSALYAPCEVTAKVADGEEISIVEKTDYPFSETIEFELRTKRSVKFPWSLRIPEWCREAAIVLNGEPIASRLAGPAFATITREWKPGDKMQLRLPMEVRTIGWTQRPGTLSVYRGPLAYSLFIKEKHKRIDKPNGWNAFEILPDSNWNYGLEPEPQFDVHTQAVEQNSQVFDERRVPVWIETKGRRIPEWTLDMYGLTAPIQNCPAKTSEPLEKIRLIPMGAARLRITVFPTVAEGADAHVWQKPPQPKPEIPTSYSFRCWWDSERALSDGFLPSASSDEDLPRFTWWDHKGTEEWVSYHFEKPRKLSECRVYWFDDEPHGGCRVPAAWKVQQREGEVWRDVTPIGEPTIVKDDWSVARFQPVQCREIRLLVRLQNGFSGGILEWEVR